MKLKAIIIDDEPAAISSIEIILGDYCKHVEIVGSTTSPFEGIKLINEQQPDLVFLDIAMPELNGIDLLRTIPNRNFAVIFVTAYNNHAIEAFKVNAVDYILKPIDINEMISAVNRASEVKNNATAVQNLHNFINSFENNSTRKLIVNHAEGTEFIDQNDIFCLKASANYTEIYLAESKLVASKNLKEIEQHLSPQHFLRIHNSWIINLKHVVRFNSRESYAELKNEILVPVSRRNKDQFLQTMTELFG